MKLELIAELKRYQAFDLNEREMVTKTINYLEATEDYLGKINSEGHITGSAWIVNQTRDKVLLTHHLKLNLWLQLGGHTELDESVESSAYREGIEESGLEYLTLVKDGIYDVDVHYIPERKKEAAHYHYDIRFLYEADDKIPLKISNESHDLKWVSVDKIDKYTGERSVLRMIEKMR